MLNTAESTLLKSFKVVVFQLENLIFLNSESAKAPTFRSILPLGTKDPAGILILQITRPEVLSDMDMKLSSSVVIWKVACSGFNCHGGC